MELAYELRPSYWIEPREGWGEGRVELLELPTNDETNDNIVVAWAPKDGLEPGKSLTCGYRITALMQDQSLTPGGRTVGTSHVAPRALGAGESPPPGATRFLIDFAGGDLSYYMSDPSAKANPRLRPLHLVVRETEFCGQRLAGYFRRRMRENSRNSVRRPRCASLTRRNYGGFCLPGNRPGLPGLYGGGCSPAEPVSDGLHARLAAIRFFGRPHVQSSYSKERLKRESGQPLSSGGPSEGARGLAAKRLPNGCQTAANRVGARVVTDLYHNVHLTN